MSKKQNRSGHIHYDYVSAKSTETEIRRDRLQTDGCWNFRRKGMGRNFLMGEGFCLGVTATFWNHNRGHSGTIL